MSGAYTTELFSVVDSTSSQSNAVVGVGWCQLYHCVYLPCIIDIVIATRIPWREGPFRSLGLTHTTLQTSQL